MCQFYHSIHTVLISCDEQHDIILLTWFWFLCCLVTSASCEISLVQNVYLCFA